MAIRWLKDIGIIKRVLAEAETSARLAAIRSLELMLSSDALKVLEESHANAISFEKFFIEKAIDNIKEFQESGVMPAEIKRAVDKQERLSKDSVTFKTFATDSDYSQEPVEIGDLSSALSSHKSQESEKNLEDGLDNHEASHESESSPSLTDMVGSSLDSDTDSSSDIASEDVSNSQNLSEESLNLDHNPSQMGYSDSSPLVDSLDRSTLVEEEKSYLNEFENADDLLPINAQSESLDNFGDSDSYDELLPSLNSSQSSALESYDDLLPPLNSNESLIDQVDTFESLLPALGSTNSDVSDDFDELMQSPISNTPLSSEDDYKDLLPPENSNDLLGLEVESLGQNVDYDDLLPPLETDGDTESNDYDDLLPPLDVSSTEYDDLLPPMSSDVNAEDLLPPLKMDADDTEDSVTSYDDLLPPLK